MLNTVGLTPPPDAVSRSRKRTRNDELQLGS